MNIQQCQKLFIILYKNLAISFFEKIVTYFLHKQLTDFYERKFTRKVGVKI